MKCIRLHLPLLLVCACLLGLCACNRFDTMDSETTDETSKTEPAQTEVPTNPHSESFTPEQTQPEIDLDSQWNGDGALKILCIGNSFSVDSMEYLYGILKDMGVENIKLGNLTISGCSLNMHLSNAKNDTADYLYSVNTHGTWTTTPENVLSKVVKSDNWDYISIQQASHDSGMSGTYRRLPDFIELLQPMCPEAQLVWNMTWAYQQDATHEAFPKYDSDQITMYQMIASSVHEKVLGDAAMQLVIPCGTAIQNARAGWLGDTLTRDGFHLSNTGRYIAALTFAHALTGKSIENVTYLPEGVPAAEKELAIEAAMLAVQKPFEISVPLAQAPQ